MLKVIVCLLCRGLSASAIRAAFVVALNLLLAVLLAGCPPTVRLDDPSVPPDVANPQHDWDRDGWTENFGDCNDADPAVHPGAEEICDRLDTDCNGAVPADEVDQDSDGVATCEGDCDDTEPLAHPGAPDFPASGIDGIDNDCDGIVDDGYYDSDNDGVVDSLDCEPYDITVYPGAPEQCNGEDDNCDGEVADEEVDADSDGFTPCEGDSDDTDPTSYPDAPELCDGVDNNLDGQVPAEELDTDADGFRVCNGDCSNADAQTYPGAPERCDGIDNDCNGLVPAVEADPDGDGFLACADDCNDSDAATFPGAPEQCNEADDDCNGQVPADEADPDGDGFAECDGDCSPSVATINPGAAEICDGIDQDCDSQIDQGFSNVDGDGFADCVDMDIDGDGFANVVDCSPLNPAVYPGAPEVPDDGIDQNCSGADTVTCFVDADGDGFGLTSTLLSPDGDCNDIGEAMISGDCNDAFPAVNPGATEQCDGMDNDCDTLTDEGFVDADGDGNADCIDSDADNDGVVNSLDCAPSVPTIYPGAPEVLDDGIDQDCNGADTVTCFVDGDGDGFGQTATTTSPDGDCADPGESLINNDCDDLDADAFPGAPEVCDGVDNDCDGLAPGETNVDGDAFLACAGDCDDGQPSVFPGAPEACNDVDDDCDGSVDEGYDADSDGFRTCDGDCQDAVAAINPGAPEVCDGLDNDCDDELEVDETDFDGDSFLECEGDCDDDDLTVYPDAPELCDDLDNDCDGAVPLGETPVGPQAYQACAQNQEDGVDGLTPDGVDEDGNGCDVDGFALADGECMAEYTMSLHPVWGIPVSVPGVQASAMSFNDWQDWTEEMGAWIPDLDLWVESCGGGNPYPYGPGNIDGACPVASSPGVPTPVLTDDYEDSCTSPWGMVQSLGGNSWEFVELPDGTWGMVGGSAQAYRPTCTTLGYSEGGYAGSPVHPNSDAPAESRFAMDPLP